MTGLFRSVVGIPLVLCAALLVGCGKGEVKTYPIPGKLVYQDNSPVPGATLVFQTTVDGKPVAARGTADSEGKFTLTTFQEGDGVVAGEHQVSVSPLPAGDGPAPVKPAVPPAYADFAGSGLKTTVSPETSEIVITIDRDK